jgi:acetate kinase
VTTLAAGDCILVLNAGSSSLKFSRFRSRDDDLELVVRGEVETLEGRGHLTVHDAAGTSLAERDLREAQSLAWLDDELAGEGVVAVGHRVVHGGTTFTQPVLVDDHVAAELERLIPLAPLHQPQNLAPIRAIRTVRPELAQVVCFDTAFHRAHPLLADLYALPWRYHEAGIRRYGFHGLSYEYIAATLPHVAPEVADGRVVVAHLGNGASLCAMRAGRSVDSTMGFSALDGIPMGTRPGDVDPGVILHLLRQEQRSADALEHLLYHECGLLGLSGVSSDMRELLASPEPRARLAVDYFVQRVAREMGALTAVMNGVDGIVFTAGIGEHAAPVRARIVEASAWLGVTLDQDANARHGPRISTHDSRVSAWVMPTNEELMIARHTVACLGGRR